MEFWNSMEFFLALVVSSRVVLPLSMAPSQRKMLLDGGCRKELSRCQRQLCERRRASRANHVQRREHISGKFDQNAAGWSVDWIQWHPIARDLALDRHFDQNRLLQLEKRESLECWRLCCHATWWAVGQSSVLRQGEIYLQKRYRIVDWPFVVATSLKNRFHWSHNCNPGKFSNYHGNLSYSFNHFTCSWVKKANSRTGWDCVFVFVNPCSWRSCLSLSELAFTGMWKWDPVTTLAQRTNK